MLVRELSRQVTPAGVPSPAQLLEWVSRAAGEGQGRFPELSGAIEVSLGGVLDAGNANTLATLIQHEEAEGLGARLLGRAFVAAIERGSPAVPSILEQLASLARQNEHSTYRWLAALNEGLLWSYAHSARAFGLLLNAYKEYDQCLGAEDKLKLSEALRMLGLAEAIAASAQTSDGSLEQHVNAMVSAQDSWPLTTTHPDSPPTRPSLGEAERLRSSAERASRRGDGERARDLYRTSLAVLKESAASGMKAVNSWARSMSALAALERSAGREAESRRLLLAADQSLSSIANRNPEAIRMLVVVLLQLFRTSQNRLLRAHLLGRSRHWLGRAPQGGVDALYFTTIESLALGKFSIPVPMAGTIGCPACAAPATPGCRWTCTCGAQWDTFETGGICPVCEKVHTETACAQCKAMSPHRGWYSTDRVAETMVVLDRDLQALLGRVRKSSTPFVRRDVAERMNELGLGALSLGRAEKAIELFERCVTLFAELARAAPADKSAQQKLAVAVHNLDLATRAVARAGTSQV